MTANINTKMVDLTSDIWVIMSSGSVLTNPI
jgi:hypothetical protein